MIEKCRLHLLDSLMLLTVTLGDMLCDVYLGICDYSFIRYVQKKRTHYVLLHRTQVCQMRFICCDNFPSSFPSWVMYKTTHP